LILIKLFDLLPDEEYNNFFCAFFDNTATLFCFPNRLSGSGTDCMMPEGRNIE